MSDDRELLQRFAQTRDEASFEILVRRYIGFVHAISRRRLRDPHSADDATQAVFIVLARKAAEVARSPSVMGWLHRCACYETLNLMRAQANRTARETAAAELGTILPQPSPDAGALEAVLDDAVSQLSDGDRNALLARFFSGHSYAQIGSTLRLTENAARMRVDRALEKLRIHLCRKGITSTVAALAAALPACAATPVASGVVSTITAASITSVAAAAGTSSIFALMSTAKIVTGTIAVAALAGLFYQLHRTNEIESQLVALRAELAQAVRQVQLPERQNETAPLVAAAAPDRSERPLQSPASTVPPSAPRPGITPKPPAGWIQNGSANNLYEVGVDETERWGGMPSAYAKSTGEADGKFGGIMQSISADTYRNQRVRLTGWIKTENAEKGAHLWMRVDGESGGSVAFDNMANRAPKGTTDWDEYSVVLDVPANSRKLNYGFFVSGKGKMWVNGITITPVGAEVPSTALEIPQPKTPVNLGFKPQAPN